ncbi:hypothetical protein [Blastomonas sp. CCH2-A2]|uniref:hypothetical protein n=1 Tax=Blastomonas sp. CCH2-A2 TaxID=1768788 RepID=UPI0008243C05|nr:hypothetical protein [Blastomonas sp. CCH2-A2]
MARVPTIGVGIPWYRRDDYPRILQIMADSDELSPTYDEWEKRAQFKERDVIASGLTPYRAYIEPDKFRAWCVMRGRELNADSRIMFAGDRANWDIGPSH